MNSKRLITKWVSVKGETTIPSSHVYSLESVSREEKFDLHDLTFRDPNFFIAGSLH